MASRPLESTTLAPAVTRGGFGDDLSAEVARLFRSPRVELNSLATNAVLVTALWTLLPAAAHDWLFALTGSMAFAVVLQAWVLGDTTTTNVLGNDVVPALDVLHDPVLLRRWLRAKAAALGLLVGLPCAAVAILVAALEHQYVDGVLLAVVVVTAPLGAAAVAAWLGMAWPYHPRPLRWRWSQRHARRRTVRWLTLVVTPFLLVPAIMAVFLAAGVATGTAVGGRDANGHLDLAGFAAATAVTAALSLTAFGLAPYLSSVLGRRRGASLHRILQDPDSA
jgi:hypothetical protein